MPGLLPTIRTELHQVSSALLRAWYRGLWGMDIGEGCKISLKARLDRTNPGGIHIGDWTAVTFDAAILSHDMSTNRHVDTYIGSHCFIGARAIVMPGVRVGDHSVVGAGSVVMTDVPPNCIVSGNPAKIVRAGVMTGRWGILDQRFLDKEAAEGRASPVPEVPRPALGAGGLPKLPAGQVIALFASELAGFDERQLQTPIKELGIDSFALINLRIAIEAQSGRPIHDLAWAQLACAADLVGTSEAVTAGGNAQQHASAAVPAPAQSLSAAAAPVMAGRTAVETGPARERRVVNVNLPQMAMRGLGEPWLMKELGDIHWSILLREIEARAASLADATGARLYATFTRIRWDSTGPLTDYGESEDLAIDLAQERYGASMFFSRGEIRGAASRGTAEIMTTFSKYGEVGANSSLLKGQPELPPGCRIPAVRALPDFAQGYRERRAADPGPVLFETDYAIQPPHDVNGAGLVYFAAYPTIAELCLARHVGPRFFADMSLVARDICYFANTEPSDMIRFRLHELVEEPDGLFYRATMARVSDGKLMALVEGRKVPVQLPPTGVPIQPRS